ncbi:MAG TPA: glycosyltransferase [Opitutaceae bacterium]|jgi:glycosyltransferase involved in cell wall biosynthesis|nr:glycosyltransferase [Opitutaceae bacterium]
MKILVLQDYLRSGGTERQSIFLTRAFASAGLETVLLTFRPGGALSTRLGDVAHRSLQPFDCHLDWFAPGLARAIRILSPDGILCMGRMANCYAGSIQKKFPHIGVIGTMRTGKPLPRLYRRSLHHVWHVVANSHDAKSILSARYGVAQERISVIHNSIVFPPAALLKRNEALRAKLDAGPTTVVFLNVAMFRLEKNQRDLIEIAARLPLGVKWQLWFVGDGPERAACERLVAQKHLGSRIKFLGFHPDPTTYYAAADLAALTSLSESLPNFLIEAHAHGLMSVAYDVGGVSETGGAVVPAGNRDAFLARLQPLLFDPALRASEAAAAQARVRENFDPQRQFQAYLDLFLCLVQPAQ